MSMKKNAVCYLTRTPDQEVIEFAEELARDVRISSNVDIYIMIDDNNYRIQQNSLINFIQINNNESISNGYHSSSKLELNTDCISWDKAIYYFCQIKQNYSFVWFIEDDSFIPSTDAFISLHEKYSQEGHGDLICQKNDENLHGDTSTWKWKDVVGKFSPPWYHSMVCAIGCSRKLLNAIANYVQQRRFLPFIEYMFNTIAMQNHLKVVNPPELNTIVWREDWTWENIRQKPYNWFHPLKNAQIRREHRLRLKNVAQVPTQNFGYSGNTGYQENAGYPRNTGYQETAGYPASTGYQATAGHPGSTGYQENAGYPGNVQCQGQMPQYPYFMPPSHGVPNSGSVLPSLVYPPNVPPPYPPH